MASVQDEVRRQLGALVAEHRATLQAQAKAEADAAREAMRRRIDAESDALSAQWRTRLDELAARAALPTSGSRRLVMPIRPLIIHVPDGAGPYSATFRATHPSRIEAVIASTTDLAAGSRACTIEYGPEGEASPMVSPLEQPNTADSPLLGEAFVDSMAAAVELDRCGFYPPLIGVPMKTDQRLVFSVKNMFGTPPYDVRLLVYMSRVGHAC